MQTQFSKLRLRLAKTALIGAVLLQLAPVVAAGKADTKRAATAGVAWIAGDSEAAVDTAFAGSKAMGKPLLLYWGAAWCPPCNQLKAMLFSRQDFIALTRAIVPVYLDGDLPGAQKLGSRFRVVGYPTLILFSSEGKEITRLPGEADASRVIESLRAGLSAGKTAESLLAAAQAGQTLSASEWQALAFYSWETDEAQLVAREQRAAVLADLAQRSQPVSADASIRLWLKSLMALETRTASPATSEPMARPPDDLTEQRERLKKVLGNPDAVRMHADVVMAGVRPIVRNISEVTDLQAAPLRADYAAALVRLQTDPQLSRADQTSALIARVELARLDVADEAVQVTLPEQLLAEVRALARRMDAEISNGYERQAVITNVADLLGEAGLWQESDALLKSNLKKSHSPYYLMSQLGGNARKLGRSAEALDWYERAYRTSRGPATRLQWGASYVGALVDLAPLEGARIETAVTSLFADAAKDPGAFYERSDRSLKRVVGKLAAWNKLGEHVAEVERLRSRHRLLCAGIVNNDPQRAVCEALWPGV